MIFIGLTGVHCWSTNFKSKIIKAFKIWSFVKQQWTLYLQHLKFKLKSLHTFAKFGSYTHFKITKQTLIVNNKGKEREKLSLANFVCRYSQKRKERKERERERSASRTIHTLIYRIRYNIGKIRGGSCCLSRRWCSTIKSYLPPPTLSFFAHPLLVHWALSFCLSVLLFSSLWLYNNVYNIHIDIS